jgi:hypothetical protein
LGYLLCYFIPTSLAVKISVAILYLSFLESRKISVSKKAKICSWLSPKSPVNKNPLRLSLMQASELKMSALNEYVFG